MFTYWLLFLLPFSSANPPVGNLISPIPTGIISRIQSERHPFLLADNDLLQQTYFRMNAPFFQERGNEFLKRGGGFGTVKSPWYIRGGPFSKESQFHPGAFSDDDFLFYTQLLCETTAYAGLGKSYWASNSLKIEVLRMLEELEPKSAVLSSGLPYIKVTNRQALMVGLISLMYDMVYFRMDWVDRHNPNRRLKQIRDRLAAYCASLKPTDLSPDDRLALGTGLGMSTLMVMSVFPQEWKKEETFSVQTLLPDLYRAVLFTRSGLEGAISEDKQLAIPYEKLQTHLLLAIPWIECMKRLGYSVTGKLKGFSRIAAALEAHRIPTTSRIIIPNKDLPFTTPWIPTSVPLFTTINSAMYKIENASAAIATAIAAAEKPPMPAANSSSFVDPLQSPELLRPIDVDIRSGGKPPSLKEMLEKYTFPKQPAPQPAKNISAGTSFLESGWTKPPSLTLPNVWGSLYVLAADENPETLAGSVWSKYGMDLDSHPYTFIFWRPLPPERNQEETRNSLVAYSETQSTIYSTYNPRISYLLSSQAAKGTILMATYAVDHESFFLSEGDTEWRWYQAVPVPLPLHSATEVISATEISPVTPAGIANHKEIPGRKKILSSTPLISSLYSYWQTDSPVGKTYIVRRHVGGLGSPYSVIIHFPDVSSKKKPMEYVNFQIPEEGDCTTDEQVHGWFSIIPQTVKEYNEINSLEAWQQAHRADRFGQITIAHVGSLKMLFSPDSVLRGDVSSGILGNFLQIRLANPKTPFFYVTSLEQPGREKYQVKYPTLSIPGLRVIEWRQGIEYLAIRLGSVIQNDFIESDANFVLVSYDQAMKGIFYLLIDGTYLRVKSISTQKDWVTLANTQNQQMSIAWAGRRIYTTDLPPKKSEFYSPNLAGFEGYGNKIEYGMKGRHTIVLGFKK